MEKQLILNSTFLTRKTMVDLTCYLFFLLFVYAATSKLLDYQQSLLQLSKSPITTDYAALLVWLVPVTELIIAALLLIQRTQTLALYACLGLMSLFTTYIIAILNFSEIIPCSCGGALQSLSWKQHLIFNLAFIALAILSIFIKPNPNKSGEPNSPQSYSNGQLNQDKPKTCKRVGT
ncbi:hypothetical protein EZ428_18585 [Pedobacter frigiditerrae]|uniref:Methylamine utilisation protein MauE domain-containing protein n=1 Tax=Pedobacter frigiditerrae TaxID=2530452 RepID=A0A4R0MPA1_9SPHI|nr:MauE/DoxX family redox-associated membrane protein [Pedobacter frigiditerrae]TCC88645.1 hypothetical protein EZ428_18585 [Pedobacter frigiditerrae]